MVGFVLALCVLAPTVEITTTPPGATVVWTRPDAPTTIAGGVTPCRIAIPGPHRGVFTFIARLDGYHPALLAIEGAALAEGAPRHLVLRPMTIDELPARLRPAEVTLPPPPAGLEVYDESVETRRTPDGRGSYQVRALDDAAGDTHQHELWWAPANGPPRLLMVWPHDVVYGHGEPWYRTVPDRDFGPTLYSELDLSPDGRWLVLSRIADGWSVIELLQPDSRKRRVLARRDDATLDYPVFAADGGAVALAAGGGEARMWVAAGAWRPTAKGKVVSGCYSGALPRRRGPGVRERGEAESECPAYRTSNSSFESTPRPWPSRWSPSRNGPTPKRMCGTKSTS